MVEQALPVIASVVTGALSAFLTYRVAMRKEKITAEEKLRGELKDLFDGERSAHGECLREVQGMRAQLTEALVSSARWEARAETMDKNISSLYQAIAGKMEAPLRGPPDAVE